MRIQNISYEDNGKHKMNRLVVLIALVGLLLSACSSPESTRAEGLALFKQTDLTNAKTVAISSEFELPAAELNSIDRMSNDIDLMDAIDTSESNTESELMTQAVLPNVDGYVAYYRSNASGYQIWTHNQTNDLRQRILISNYEVQSVAVDAYGQWVAASIADATGQFDIYLFDIVGNAVNKLTNTVTKDEIDVSMTVDASKIVYTKPTNTGVNRVNVCDYSSSTSSCTISILSGVNQGQATISGNGKHIALTRNSSNGVNRVLIYDMVANSYTTVLASLDPLLHPSVSNDGSKVMYIRDRTAVINRYLVRIMDLKTSTAMTELSSETVSHSMMTADAEYFGYSALVGSYTKLFTRNIRTNQRPNTGGGNWNYGGAYWQKIPRPKVIAYAWANNHIFASYTLPIAWSYNSTGGTITGTRTGVGAYTITFAGQNFDEYANIQVSGYAGFVASCTVTGWSGADVDVQCYNSGGATSDEKFNISVTQTDVISNAKIVGYVLSDQISPASTYTPAIAYNAAGPDVTVQKTSTGYYRVNFPNLLLNNGRATIHVTAYDSDDICEVFTWTNGVAIVQCYNNMGGRVDSKFTAQAIVNDYETGARTLGYAIADKPNLVSYTPNPTNSYNATGGAITATKLGTGSYNIDFAGIDISDGSVKVTAYDNDTRCNIDSWSVSDVNVLCYDASALLKNSKYSVTVMSK